MGLDIQYSSIIFLFSDLCVVVGVEEGRRKIAGGHWGN